MGAIMIDKQQCVGLENALKNGMTICFLHQGHEISVRRCLIQETKLIYAVYINGQMYLLAGKKVSQIITQWRKPIVGKLFTTRTNGF